MDANVHLQIYLTNVYNLFKKQRYFLSFPDNFPPCEFNIHPFDQLRIFAKKTQLFDSNLPLWIIFTSNRRNFRLVRFPKLENENNLIVKKKKILVDCFEFLLTASNSPFIVLKIFEILKQPVKQPATNHPSDGSKAWTIFYRLPASFFLPPSPPPTTPPPRARGP